MDLKLENYNVRDATLRSLLAAANEFGIKTPTDGQMDVLSEIGDALEARVQDAMDQEVKNATSIEVEDEFVPAEEVDTHLHMENEEVDTITHKGVVFGKFCNESVFYDPENGVSTSCIKKWNHMNPEHEDIEGNLRL